MGLEKESRLLLDKNNIEELLLEAGKYSMLSARLFGYFPFSVTLSSGGWKVLEFRKWSLSFLYSVLVAGLCVLGSSSFYYFIYLSVNSGIQVTTAGKAVWASYTYLSTYSSLLRLCAILRQKRSLQLWQNTLRLVRKLGLAGIRLEGRRVVQIGDWTKKWVLFYVLGGGCHFLYKMYQVDHSLKPIPFDSVKFSAYLSVVILGSFSFHVGYLVWLTFVLQVIIISFEAIEKDLKRFTAESLTLLEVDDSSCRPKEVILLERKVAYAALLAKINSSLDVFESIEDHVIQLSEYVGPTLVVETVYVVLLLTLYIYRGIREVRAFSLDTCITIVLPVAIFTAALNNFAGTCECVSATSGRILRCMERAFTGMTMDRPEAVHLRVLAVITRLADNPISINAAHFCTMNRSLISWCAGAIGTYAVILLQQEDG